MQFQIDNVDGNARATTIKTAHSIIKTPVFMPVGTNAVVKALDFNDMLELNTKIILANTYHLYLRPGSKVVKNFGGLHRFSKYPNSFLTDSGGFQAFSLNKMSKTDDNGILFQSHIDGSKHFFTPEFVLDIQYDLNSDIMMILDDLVSLPNTKKRIASSIDRTTEWAKRSIAYHRAKQSEGIGLDNNIFAIIQGGIDFEFRKKSASELCELDFDGFAIGGLSVGELNNQMYDTVEFTTQLMPKEKPRYLMGVGTPQDLVECIDKGIDMFDCVMPTRNARNGTLFTNFGKISIKKSIYKLDNNPIDTNCNCYTCKNFSLGYLHHLFKAKELTYFRLASIHNLYYYLTLISDARKSILNNKWNEFKKNFYSLKKFNI